MLKQLRSFVLAAALLLPLAMHAQETLTVYDGTNTNSYVPVYGNYADYGCRSQFIYPASDLAAMSGRDITQLTFYASQASISFGQQFTVYMKEVTNTTFASAALDDWSTMNVVYVGTIGVSGNQMVITLSSPYSYGGGNLMIGFQVTDWSSVYGSSSWYGQNQTAGTYTGVYNTANSTHVWSSTINRVAFLPKTTFGYEVPLSCGAVKNLAVDPTLTTSNTLSLSWTDEDNTSATYSVYRLTDTDTIPVASNLTTTSYTATGLEANTVYTFGVKADCGPTDGLSALRTVSGRTECGPVALPYSTSFEASENSNTLGSYPLPWCWNRYNSASSTSNYFPYSYTSSYTAYGRTGSYALYIYAATTASYADTMIAILPQVDVANFPMNNNQLRFWARGSSASTALDLHVGTMTDPNDPSTFVLDQTVTVTGNTYTEYEALIGVNATGSYPAIRILKPASYMTVYIDDLLIEVRPSCIKPAVSAVATSSTVTLDWENTNADGTNYSILMLQGTDTLSYTTTTDTTYTFSGLPEYTNFSFVVRAVCSDTDSSRAVSASARTLRAGCKMTSFNLTGNARREAPVMDTLAEPYFINAPVWYTDNLPSNSTFSWSVSTSAAVFIDTAADGSFTCQVTTTSIKNYLQMNTPTVLRVKAEDRNVYTDYTLTLQTETCVAARNLQVDPERIRINASWACPDTLVTEFHVLISPTQLDAAALAAATPTVVSDRQYTFEGLTRETQYYIYVKSACDTTWLEQAVSTMGLSACETYDGSTGTSIARYFFPGYYGFQYAGNLYNIDQSVGLTGISAYLATGNNSTGATLKVWVKEVGPDFVFTNTITFEEMTTGATLIFDGDASNLTTANVGWVQFPFSDVMNVTAGNQLLVLSRGTGCSTSGGCSRAERYTNKPGKMWYKQQDSNDPGMTTTGTVSSSRLNIQVCYTADACPEVTAISADSVTNNSAKIVWTASSADYCVGNQIIVSPTEIDAADLDAATAVSLAADAVSYQATGLNPDHDYYVYIKTLCNGSEHPEGTSGWATFQFRTFPTCRTPEIVSATVTGKHTAQFVINNTGADLGQANNFSYLLSTTLLSEADLAAATATANGIDTTVFTLDNLASATKYYIYVQNVCPADNCSSPWSQPDSVLMPEAMPAPINLAAFDQSHNAFSAVWVRDEVNFADETAWRAAAALHGQAATDWVTVETAIAGTQPLQAYNLFTGLLADTAYDIYVCAYDAVTGLTSDTVRLDSIRTAVDPGNPTVVGRGDANNGYVPVYGNYTDAQQRTQSIYPASMLTDLVGQTITGIEYVVVNKGTAYNGGWENYTFNVSLAVTDSANLANGWDATPTTNVYTGTLHASVEGGMKITFNTPFVYNGGNLLVSFELPTDENGYTNCLFAGSTVENASRYVYGSSYQTAAGTLINFLPQANFRTTNESSCYDVTTAYQTGLTGFTADFAWQPGNQETAWQYVINTSDTLTNAELETLAQNVATNSVALTDLLRDTNYTFYLRAACSDTEHSRWTKLPFTTPFEHFDVTVTTAVNDAAMGTATGDTVVPDGDTVTLVATPAEGHHFVSWSNGETTDTIRIVATADTTLTATFAINTYTVVVNADATMGSVSGIPTDAVEHGAVVTLIALPSEGYHFTGWSNGITTDTLNLTVVADTILTATFAINTYSVTVNADATMGSVAGVPTAAVNHGSTVTLTATAETGYHFVNWTDADGNEVSNANPYTLTVSSDTALTANFESDGPAVVNLTVNCDATMGTVTGAPAVVREGDQVTLTATANEGYLFVNWTSGSTVLGTSETLTLTVTSDTTITANFEAGHYTVTAIASPANAGTITGVPTSEVPYNTTVTLTATANTGYEFVAWTDANGSVVSIDPIYTFSVTDNVDLTANFEAVPVYITVTANIEGSGYVLGAGVYEVGSTVVLTAQANEGWHFVRWSNGATTASITIENVSSDTTLTAYFEEGTVGIDEFDMENVSIYATDNKVVVRGAEGQNINIFDVNGRCLATKAYSAETEEITVSNAGVYLVKVGNAPAKRVVVVR